jgi:hypothetical protein
MRRSAVATAKSPQHQNQQINLAAARRAKQSHDFHVDKPLGRLPQTDTTGHLGLADDDRERAGAVGLVLDA